MFWTRTGSDTFGLTLLKAEAASPSSSHSKCELLHLQGGLCWSSAAACQKSHLCTSKMIAYCYSWSLPSCTFRRLYWSLCCWIWDTCCVTVAWSCSFWDVKVLIRCFSSSSSWSCERKKSTILYIYIYSYTINSQIQSCQEGEGKQQNLSSTTWCYMGQMSRKAACKPR